MALLTIAEGVNYWPLMCIYPSLCQPISAMSQSKIWSLWFYPDSRERERERWVGAVDCKCLTNETKACSSSVNILEESYQ